MLQVPQQRTGNLLFAGRLHSAQWRVGLVQVGWFSIETPINLTIQSLC
jgi:hypothetical protein